MGLVTGALVELQLFILLDVQLLTSKVLEIVTGVVLMVGRRNPDTVLLLPLSANDELVEVFVGSQLELLEGFPVPPDSSDVVISVVVVVIVPLALDPGLIAVVVWGEESDGDEDGDVT